MDQNRTESINTTAADGQRYCRTLSYDADSCPCNDHQKRLGTGFSCDRSGCADHRLTIQAGKSRFALQTLDAGDFPTVAQAQTFDLSVQITQKAFKALLGC